MNQECDISTLVGQTLTSVKCNDAKDELHFVNDKGEKYVMLHQQDCCESVSIEDICGDLTDLENSVVLKAERTTSEDRSRKEQVIRKLKQINGESTDNYDGSQTFTFFHISTNKGTVTIRWYGSSNGYYSEDADFYKIEEDEPYEEEEAST